jgi:hypothetical protein
MMVFFLITLKGSYEDSLMRGIRLIAIPTFKAKRENKEGSSLSLEVLPVHTAPRQSSKEREAIEALSEKKDTDIRKKPKSLRNVIKGKKHTNLLK